MHLGLRKTNTEAPKVDLIRKLNQNQIKAEKENKPSYFMRDIKHASVSPNLPNLQEIHFLNSRTST